MDTRCDFGFTAPPDLHDMRVQGQDSCVASYDSAECHYSGDRGPYSASLTSLRGQVGYRAQTTEIDDVKATIVSVGPTAQPRPYFTAVHFEVGPNGLADKLTVAVTCDLANAARIAEATFPTLPEVPIERDTSNTES